MCFLQINNFVSSLFGGIQKEEKDALQESSQTLNPGVEAIFNLTRKQSCGG